MSNNSAKIVLVGGGTGGHFYPLVSVCHALRQRQSTYKFEYFGTGLKNERDLARENGMLYQKILTGKFRREKSLLAFLKNIGDFFLFIAGIIQSLYLLSTKKPDLVFSKGGYAALPVVLAAGLLRIPVVSHESDATAGLANRIGSLVSTRLGVAFPLDAYPQSIKQRSFYCGIPLREEFKKIWREGSQPENFILATGGSLGGRNLNSLIFKIAPQVLTKSTIVHLTGEFDLERAKEFKKLLPLKLQGRYHPIGFSNEMPKLISKAKLVISRCGATAVFEIAACRKNAIFVPIPKTVTNHQIINALYLHKNGLADIHFQEDSHQNLVRKINDQLSSNTALDLARIYFSHSAELISQIIEDEVTKTQFKKIKNIFLIGMSGVSMKAIADLLKTLGKRVSGSDLKIHGHSAQNITADLDLVVYSSAASESSEARVEHAEARRLKIETIKRSELIGILMRGKSGISVSGMHGKTTISSLIANIFKRSFMGTSYLVGTDSTTWNKASAIGSGKYFIAEACEYDDSFLDFPTTIGLISNIEEEHLDYFKGGLAEIKKHFGKFVDGIYPGGALVYCADDVNIYSVIKERADLISDKRISLISYGFKPTADFSIRKYTVANGKAKFTIVNKTQRYEFISGQVGKHFALNCASAFAVSKFCGVLPETVASTVRNFKGASRRFVLKGEVKGIKIYDDYAHHPTEISATISALNELFPAKRKFIIFQPHQQDRFNRFYRQFENVLKSSRAFEIILLPVFKVVGRDAAAEHTSQDLAQKLQSEGKNVTYLENYDEAVRCLMEFCASGDIIMTMGATDVYKVADKFLRSKVAKHSDL